MNIIECSFIEHSISLKKGYIVQYSYTSAATDLESQIIGVVGGLLAVVLIAAIAVVVVLWKKYKKGTGHINQGYDKYQNN